ncbi:VOC family protein [Actinomadura graeca]|uniref:VOC family protein n=1 Tax=Actinomadura graeca TaxID=2750812 RepID=A0ABX8R487_9ACTN|nr:VOC family protein [Actinomadura graeca]QXJ25891.1 VOC family protein [Actinomadura graeca]
MSERLKGIAYVELYVADGPAIVDHYVNGLLFEEIGIAYGWQQRSVLLASGTAQVLITSPQGAGGPVADYLARHGDGVADIAVYVSELATVLTRAHRAGLRVLQEPTYPTMTDDVRIARIDGAGSVQHTLIAASPGLPPEWPPGFVWEPPAAPRPSIAPALESLRPRGFDHFAWCLPTGSLESVVSQYRETFGMTIAGSDQITAGATVANSHVLRGDSGLTHVMVETDRILQPHPGGHIEEFIERHAAAGVQHIALATDDLLTAVPQHADGGVQFLPTPGTYYEMLPRHLRQHPAVNDQLADLHTHGILLDQDGDGLIYQIFTTSPHTRDTLFYELIQRRGGATGFGHRNAQALFEAREAHATLGSAPQPDPG